MAEKRDYYEVLGISKTATADDIKSAYRKAAIKWHPDKWVNGTDAEKKTAEEKFKEASEAYSVLSDPDKRSKYDQFGEAGLGGNGGGFDFNSAGFGNLNDILNDLFGGGFGGFSGFGGFGGGGGQQQQKVYRGRDIRTRVKLTLEEIANGCTKEVSIERDRPCPECNGKGAKSESDIKTCPNCHGSGQEQRVTNSFFGQSVVYTTCSRCGGEGKIIDHPCHCCNGTGLVRKREKVKVTIPAGVENGMQLTVRGEGHGAKHNGVNGDLLILIEEETHPQLRRKGNNLFYTKVLTLDEAILGTEVAVPCLDGTYKFKVDPGVQSGKIVKLKGRGVPSVNSYGRSTSKGDLYVKLLVWIPRKLDRKQREAIENMKEAFQLNMSNDDKALFEQMKENF